MNRRRSLLVLVVVSGVACWSPPAQADIPLPPYSYRQVSPDGQYVLVMVAPVSSEEDPEGWNEDLADDIREIRRLYTRSGLYRNDGSAEPLWTVDWYAHRVDIASDGVHLVRHGPWASSTKQEALSFFAAGVLLRSYRIRDLVDNPLLMRRSVSHFFWEKKGRFDDAGLEYHLKTMDGNRFTFDLRSGEIVSASRPARAVLLGGAVLALGVGFLVWRVLKRRRALGTGHGDRLKDAERD
jgi:hypothetical protein